MLHCTSHLTGMADAPPSHRPRRAAAVIPLPDTVALVLQGGGALGSFQAGVYEGLAADEVEIDWVAGISIGAINAALIAGNPPERRVAALHAFWDKLGSSLPSFPLFGSTQDREFVHEWSAGFVALAGVPGFFRPRMIQPQFATPGTPGALSYYATAPLRGRCGCRSARSTSKAAISASSTRRATGSTRAT